MKINNVGPSGMNPYKNNLNKFDATKKSLFSGKDKIEISTTAKDLQQSSQIVAQRQEKVQQLKLSVENGTYKLDPRGTARSLVDFYSKK
ncbi:flagellar biosynthesis anti-sigma factor FlgM [Bacillus massiliigorillae]|uniref:flagellar biosynthesis anti-sigma factor FlgM n=1 Tax=Bacillus massiliigorillae TaxID=1243664 RepID=UPI00039F7891|nr:flagellar biosynthesis anti-sigma factor FlgM [Bacillus massiliigorillae]